MSRLDKLGFYLVGWTKFYNKTLALIESKKTGYKPIWIFNDDVYGKINWSIPIETPLEKLYARRAQQLRDTYDYIILSYSGGADSLNMLRVFLDNNIFIDEIMMCIPEPDRKNLKDGDTSIRNIMGEVEYVAIPYIKSIQNILDSKTKITIQDISKPLIEILKKDDWIENFDPGVRCNPTPLSSQYLNVIDEHFLKLSNTGKKICKLYGIDKPLVICNGTDYHAYFQDASVYHVGISELSGSKHINDRIVTELFYWNAEVPEIVVKQAQLIKLNCELDPIKKKFWSKMRHIVEFREVMHPIIYPDLPPIKFQAGKQTGELIKTGDNYESWFWDVINKTAKHNFLEAMSFMEKNILSSEMIGGQISKGFLATSSRYYKL
jgi:hypothetical protein